MILLIRTGKDGGAALAQSRDPVLNVIGTAISTLATAHEALHLVVTSTVKLSQLIDQTKPQPPSASQQPQNGVQTNER
jgi:hypothetical protein